MNEYRNQNGFIQIKDLKGNGYQPTKLFDDYSFIYGNDRYFYKRTKDNSQVYNEMIGYELACDFGINSISYDLAMDDNEYGVVSKDFMRLGYVYLRDLLSSCYEETGEACNLDDSLLMIMEKFGDNISEILEDFIHMMMFDIIIDNHDRNSGNIIIDINTCGLGPLLDNEMLLNGNNVNHYSFRVSRTDDNTIDNFIKILDNKQLKFFYEKLEIINSSNLDSVFKRIESKIGTKMNEVLKDRIRIKYSEHYIRLKRIIKEELGSRKLLLKSR